MITMEINSSYGSKCLVRSIWGMMHWGSAVPSQKWFGFVGLIIQDIKLVLKRSLQFLNLFYIFMISPNSPKQYDRLLKQGYPLTNKRNEFNNRGGANVDSIQ